MNSERFPVPCLLYVSAYLHVKNSIPMHWCSGLGDLDSVGFLASV